MNDRLVMIRVTDPQVARLRVTGENVAGRACWNGGGTTIPENDQLLQAIERLIDFADYEAYGRITEEEIKYAVEVVRDAAGLDE